MKIDKKKLGQILIYVGVSTWIPYFYLLFTGAEPKLYTFLPVHLLFVISGVRIRKSAGEEAPKTERAEKLREASKVLLLIGMTAWLPYFYVRYYYQLDVGHTPFLVLHLTGMLGGGVLRLF